MAETITTPSHLHKSSSAIAILQRSTKAVAVDEALRGSSLHTLKEAIAALGRSPELNTSLHEAVKAGKKEFVEELLKDVEVGARNGSFETPLIIAAQIGNIDMARLLIARCVADKATADKVCCKDSHDMTALHHALRGPTPHLELAILLLKNGAEVNATDGEGWSCLHFACYNGQEDVVDLLLGHDGIEVNCAAEGDHWTPMHCAARAGSSAILNKLLDKGAMASIEKREGRRGDSPLSIAAWSGRREICEILLCHNKDCLQHDTDNTGWTPLMKASYKGHLDVVQLLVQHDSSKEHLAHASHANG